MRYRCTSLKRNCQPPEDRHRALDIVLPWGPRGGAVLYERGTPVVGSEPASTVQAILVTIIQDTHRPKGGPMLPGRAYGRRKRRWVNLIASHPGRCTSLKGNSPLPKIGIRP